MDFQAHTFTNGCMASGTIVKIKTFRHMIFEIKQKQYYKQHNCKHLDESALFDKVEAICLLSWKWRNWHKSSTNMLAVQC